MIVSKKQRLSTDEVTKLVRAHEDGDTARELAKQYGISPRSVAAYVANAHR
jgi:DNA-binding CsgD family transcriptional regulator